MRVLQCATEQFSCRQVFGQSVAMRLSLASWQLLWVTATLSQMSWLASERAATSAQHDGKQDPIPVSSAWVSKPDLHV